MDEKGLLMDIHWKSNINKMTKSRKVEKTQGTFNDFVVLFGATVLISNPARLRGVKSTLVKFSIFCKNRST